MFFNEYNELKEAFIVYIDRFAKKEDVISWLEDTLEAVKKNQHSSLTKKFLKDAPKSDVL